MYYSKYNVIFDFEDIPQYSILNNLFHGQATILNRDFSDKLKYYINKSQQNKLQKYLTSEQFEILKEKRFIFKNINEETKLINDLFKVFNKVLLKKNSMRSYQILLTYDCNLRCIYCFQKKNREITVMDTVRLNRILELIEEFENSNEIEIKKNNLQARTPLISITGGEPLQDDINFKLNILTIINFVKTKKYNYSITTNGVNLKNFISVFKEINYFPNSIQITLDGPQEIHDKRRQKVDQKGSFNDIVQNIDIAVNENLPLNLRINLDEMNIDYLAELSNFIINKGWHLNNNFTAYLAPVSDHSKVNNNYKWLSSERNLLLKILTMFKQNPKLESLYKIKNFRGFEYVNKVVKGEELPIPTFWRCEAVLGQLIFDPLGDIYTCFEGSGKKSAKIGKYFPKFHINSLKLKSWYNLNSISNKWCSSCKYKFVCARGCPWNIINTKKTECLPIEEEMKLAWNFYAKKVLKRCNKD